MLAKTRNRLKKVESINCLCQLCGDLIHPIAVRTTSEGQTNQVFKKVALFLAPLAHPSALVLQRKRVHEGDIGATHTKVKYGSLLAAVHALQLGTQMLHFGLQARPLLLRLVQHPAQRLQLLLVRLRTLAALLLAQLTGALR